MFKAHPILMLVKVIQRTTMLVNKVEEVMAIEMQEEKINNIEVDN